MDVEVFNYWNIDNIIAEEEKVMVKFRASAKGLGFLDLSKTGNQTEDLESGDEVQLPLWLASTFASRRFVDIQLPNYLSLQFKSSLVADPEVINLKQKSEYFYEIGIMLAHTLSEHSQFIHTLLQIFLIRYRAILDKSRNWDEESDTPFLRKLTIMERRIFDINKQFIDQYRKWRNRKIAQIQVCSAILPDHKRMKTL